MAMIDDQLIFSDGQVINTTENSDDVVDLRAASRLGSGEPMYFVVKYLSTTGAGNFTATLQGADDEAITSNVITIVASGTVTSPAAGDRYVAAIPLHTRKRYYRVAYTMSANSVTVQTYLSNEQESIYAAD